MAEAEQGVTQDVRVMDAAKVRSKLVGCVSYQYHTIKTAKKAAKKATQFELQRHVRLMKQVQSGKAKQGPPLAELEEELAVLKDTDVHTLATQALTSKLVKAKLVPRPSVVAQLGEDETRIAYPVWSIAQELGLDTRQDAKARSTREERVVHRIQSAKALAEELTTCLTAIQALVHPQKKAPTKASPPPEKTPRAHPVQQDESDGYSSDDGFESDEAERVIAQRGAADDDLDALDGMVASGSDTSEVGPATYAGRKRQ